MITVLEPNLRLETLFQDNSILNLSAFANQIHYEELWKKSDRNMMTLCKIHGMQITLIALRGGAIMTNHRSEVAMSIQVLEGSIEIDVGQKEYILVKGEVIVLSENLLHKVLAKEESLILMTTANTNKI